MQDNFNNIDTFFSDENTSVRFEAEVKPPPHKVDLFGAQPIKSIGFNQDEIIEDILQLHSLNKKIDIDPTYSIGNFYKGRIEKPKYKFDIDPQCEGVLQSDARHLPLGDGSVETIMFDPPFLVGSETETTGKIKGRFSWFESYRHLWDFYFDALTEFYRILKPKGIVIFKCQDFITGGKQHFSHVEIMNYAVQIGYYPKDLFTLFVKTRMFHPKDVLGQQHARKYHCYFWVFEKSNCKILYGRSV